MAVAGRRPRIVSGTLHRDDRRPEPRAEVAEPRAARQGRFPGSFVERDAERRSAAGDLYEQPVPWTADRRRRVSRHSIVPRRLPAGDPAGDGGATVSLIPDRVSGRKAERTA